MPNPKEFDRMRGIVDGAVENYLEQRGPTDPLVVAKLERPRILFRVYTNIDPEGVREIHANSFEFSKRHVLFWLDGSVEATIPVERIIEVRAMSADGMFGGLVK